jgi:3-methylcrotonyl-CoA carboxylase alpha subunit
VHLFERDCSVQRRHQKVVEEAPAPGMRADVREAMGAAAVAAARAIGYVGAGTVEFIVGEGFARDGRFHFMEMNTRLQVEHPVTEMITGLDLVEWQLRVAAGEPLPLAQSAIVARGHAIEARLYAEDPGRGFLPSIGTLTHWRMPAASAQVRVDTGFRAGDTVTPYYDPMLAKVIAWGDDRDAARRNLATALAQCEVAGVATNVELLERIVAHDAFARAELDTGLIERHRDALLAPATASSARARVVAAAAEYLALAASTASHGDRWSPWNARDGWWLGLGARGVVFEFRDAAATHALRVRPRPEGTLAVEDATACHRASVEMLDGRVRGTIDGKRVDAAVVRVGQARHVFGAGARALLECVDPLRHAGVVEDASGRLAAPMSGMIVAVLAATGQQVERGAPLVVLEAMKMEHTIAAPVAGTVAAVNCALGERVSEGADLVDLTPAER